MSLKMMNSNKFARTLEDLQTGSGGSYLAAVDYPILQSLGKLTCGTDLSFYGNIQEIGRNYNYLKIIGFHMCFLSYTH